MYATFRAASLPHIAVLSSSHLNTAESDDSTKHATIMGQGSILMEGSAICIEGGGEYARSWVSGVGKCFVAVGCVIGGAVGRSVSSKDDVFVDERGGLSISSEESAR